MIDRNWPFDICRGSSQAGMGRHRGGPEAQRVKALNLFINDLYHDQQIVRTAYCRPRCCRVEEFSGRSASASSRRWVSGPASVVPTWCATPTA